PLRVARIAGTSRIERGSASLVIRSSQRSSSSSSAAGVAPVSTSASRQPSAAFAHFSFSCCEIRTSIMRAASRFPRTLSPLSLLEAADVCNQSLNLVGLQTFSISRHFVLAFLDRSLQFGVALAGNLGIGKTHHSHVLARRRIAFSRSTVAHRAFRLV